jgi:hypothetical protein
MRQLTASGVWSEAKAAKRLKDIGWIPSDADEAAKAWAAADDGRRAAVDGQGRDAPLDDDAHELQNGRD